MDSSLLLIIAIFALAGFVKGVVGLGLPSENRAYVKEGVTQAVILWNVEELGYLSIMAGAAVASGELKAGATEFTAGKLGKLDTRE